MFNNNRTKTYGSIKELAEAKRQEVWGQMRADAAAMRDAETSGEDSGAVYGLFPRGRQEDEDGPQEAAHWGGIAAGAFRNKTKDANIVVVGDFKGTDLIAMMISPGKASPDGFDADFFKCNDIWYKISVFTSYVTGENNRYTPGNYWRIANSDEIKACEDAVRRYRK